MVALVYPLHFIDSLNDAGRPERPVIGIAGRRREGLIPVRPVVTSSPRLLPPLIFQPGALSIGGPARYAVMNGRPLQSRGR